MSRIYCSTKNKKMKAKVMNVDSLYCNGLTRKRSLLPTKLITRLHASAYVCEGAFERLRNMSGWRVIYKPLPSIMQWRTVFCNIQSFVKDGFKQTRNSNWSATLKDLKPNRPNNYHTVTVAARQVRRMRAGTDGARYGSSLARKNRNQLEVKAEHVKRHSTLQEAGAK